MGCACLLSRVCLCQLMGHAQLSIGMHTCKSRVRLLACHLFVSLAHPDPLVNRHAPPYHALREGAPHM